MMDIHPGCGADMRERDVDYRPCLLRYMTRQDESQESSAPESAAALYSLSTEHQADGRDEKGASVGRASVL